MLWLKKLWYHKLGGKATPWVEVKYIPGEQPTAREYNEAYLQLALSKIPERFRKDWDPTAIVNAYMRNPNREYDEEPYLDVEHLGLARDGTVRMRLDWNNAFIRHLQEHGIDGETEDEAVQKYLQMLVHKQHDEFAANIDQTFHEYPDGIDPITDELQYGEPRRIERRLDR